MFLQTSKNISCDAYNCGQTFHCVESLRKHQKIHKWGDFWHSEKIYFYYISLYPSSMFYANGVILSKGWKPIATWASPFHIHFFVFLQLKYFLWVHFLHCIPCPWHDEYADAINVEDIISAHFVEKQAIMEAKYVAIVKRYLNCII